MARLLTIAAFAVAAAVAAPVLDKVSRAGAPGPGSQSAHHAGSRGIGMPQPEPAGAGSGAVTVPAGRNGHYTVTASIQGRSIGLLVDTGASAVLLSYEDAQRIGLSLVPSDFRTSVSTANGVAKVAPVTLNEIRVGTIRVPNVRAAVAQQGALSESLLGMTFLGRLNRVEMQKGYLVLVQ